MSEKNLKHHDCLNFAPIDVAKGICRITNKIIFTDTNTCPKFIALKKCKNCAHFTNPNSKNIGTCLGLEKESWTYGELCAVTCEGYKEK
ncbi:4-hydroxyphenylacetate decarboxylase small subunit [Crassaminicella indica]|uniref:4-hydroxyphenylacetate decarboxylase small subunit n=1 Tax=Crassaminicella indica TaxID=2855394 RepID=A0ABX8RCV5_9CLOT|nr:4-hydroxyphenylacetate decarboxylase small subunit [Crassaminicella indica]QXM06897.1 4-hydroxyphenylacetate decarboxylase small subunit [Crassaminicella indica]